MTARLVDIVLSQPRTLAASVMMPLPAGAGALTRWRDSRVRERQAAAAQAETQQAQQALAAFRRGGQALARRPVMPRAAAIAAAAFEVVDGARAFGAADTDRLTTGWTSTNTGINADLERALPTLRARSRDWVLNTDIGRRYIDLVKDNVIGSTAPRLQVRATLTGTDTLDEVANTAIETHWARWCEHADIGGRLNFAQICRVNVGAAARDGEYLNFHVLDRMLPYGYALQLMDVDRIYTGNGALAAAQGTNIIRLGVELDTRGRAVAYHLYSGHPGDGAAGLAPKPLAQRVPADQVMHGYVYERAEQVRGYPWTHAILRRANTLHAYEGYGLEAAKIGAAKMGFYTIDKDAPGGDPPTFEDYKDATGQLVQEVEAGMLEALPPGVDFKSFNPDYPHQNFASFVGAFERRISAGLNVAHHNLSGDMSGVNYSSARIAELAERDHWRGLQLWFIQAFVQPVFEKWLRIALTHGEITLPSGAPLPADRFEKFRSAASFQPRGWRWVDPNNDMKAAEMGLSNNLTSARQIVEEQGGDLDEILLDQQRYRQRLKALGLPIPGDVPAAPPAAAPAATETTA